MNHTEFFRALGEGELSGPYLFVGEEQYVKEQALNQLRARFLDDALGDFNCQALEAPGAQEIIDAGETLPFMAPRRLVVVRDCALLRMGGRALRDEKEQADRLADWLPGPESALIVFYQRGEYDKRKKLYQALQKKGQIVQFSPLQDQELFAWIRAEAKKRNRSLAPDALRRLPELSGRMLSDLHQELEKLCAYGAGEGEITLADVDAVATRTASFTVFQLIDIAARGDIAGALRMYRALMEEGQSPLGILSLLARNLRNLLRAKRMSAAGRVSAPVLAKALSMPTFAAERTLNQARAYQEETLVAALRACAEADWRIKSGQEKDEEAVERLLIALSARDFQLS